MQNIKYISMKAVLIQTSQDTMHMQYMGNVPWMLLRSTRLPEHLFLSSIRLNGSLVYTTYQGGTTAQRFREYMGKQLIPSLERDDVVIMDNMRSHHAKIVTELLDKAGISYLYLPPYSPDLNPIEKMWSKMKSFLRKRKVRVAAELPEAVKAALKTISTNDCKGGPRIWDLR